jgi:hypothetical protein
MYFSYSSEEIGHHMIFHICQAIFDEAIPMTSKWQTSGNEIVKMVENRYDPGSGSLSNQME